jgi:hypothetical protein
MYSAKPGIQRLMKATALFFAIGVLFGGMVGCATPDSGTSAPAGEQSQKPRLLPEQVTHIAKLRATDQKVVLNDFNMAPPQLERRAGKLIWSVLFTPKADGLVGANFFIEIEDATRLATYHGER